MRCFIKSADGSSRSEYSPANCEAIFQTLNRVIWVVTSTGEVSSDTPHRGGLVATWVSQASLDPEKPVVSVGLAPNHFTAKLVDSSGRFVVHLLNPTDSALAFTFCLGSGQDRDKLAEVESFQLDSGSVVLSQAIAWMECEVFARVDGGDRLYFWGHVAAANQATSVEPMREHDLFSAATAEQKSALRQNLVEDIETQRPWFDQWLKNMPQELRPMSN